MPGAFVKPFFIFFSEKNRGRICPGFACLQFDVKLGNHAGAAVAEVVCVGAQRVHPAARTLGALGFADADG